MTDHKAQTSKHLVNRSLITLLMTAILSGCAGYVPGRQSYWDAQVREMCAKDGGVTVYRQIKLSEAQATALPKIGAYYSIPPRNTAKSDAFAFWDETVTILNEANPRVWRSEQIIRQRADEEIVARVIRYIRVGGDIPSIAHASSINCPDEIHLLAQREKIFLIQGEKK